MKGIGARALIVGKLELEEAWRKGKENAVMNGIGKKIEVRFGEEATFDVASPKPWTGCPEIWPVTQRSGIPAFQN